MIQIIKRNILSAIMALFVLVGSGLMIAPTALAATSPSDAASQACAGVTAAAGGTCEVGKTSTDATALINTIIDLLSWVIGVIAVIMIIFGGFKFVTSAGDSGKVTSARSTIIYALIGLVVVALAQTIVKFVLGQFIK
jgi:hypothetical protein